MKASKENQLIINKITPPRTIRKLFSRNLADSREWDNISEVLTVGGALPTKNIIPAKAVLKNNRYRGS